jgi:hypothetical protein
MKSICLLVCAVCLICGGVQAGTVDTWKGPTGIFTDGTKWSKGGPTTWTSTSSNDELKVTTEASVCTVNMTGSWIYKLTMASGPTGATLSVADGASFSIGEVRVGASGATTAGPIGYVNQTGGTISMTDLVLGRAGSSGTGKGYYTISGGTLTYNSGATGRIYVGAGTGGAYCEGTLTIVGSAATIQMKSLYVGSENGTNAGKGTLAFQIGSSGVSPIAVSDGVFLGTAGASSTTNLQVSTTATSLPATDIVLVHLTGSSTFTGRFDAMNGGAATEGTQIVLAGNTYTLTYQYAVEAGTANDIALVYTGGAADGTANTPVPADGTTVDTSLALLDWTNPDPVVAGNSVYCDVYLGTAADRASMDKVTLGNDISQVDINTTNFPTYGVLVNQTQYHWAVDVHDDAGNLRTGAMWSFTASHNDAPVVNAGPDQVVWLGAGGVAGQEVVYLDGTTSDDGPYTVTWTQVANGAPTVTITPNNVDDTSVTVTARGTYQFRLTASDGVLQTSDTVQVIVGASSCDASHLSTGAPYNAADQNHDCVVNMTDFAVLIVADWLTCTDRLTNCGN